MGKGKKRSGKEKDGKTLVDSDIDIREETPLPKLVLKVGKEKKQKDDVSLSQDGGEHSHHKKKKKKHKHRNEEGVVEKKIKKKEVNEVIEGEIPVKKIPARVAKEKEKKETFIKEVPVSPLNLCLENLHRNLQRKDVYGIFSFPVTDLIAPGYSKIIKIPMDFLTMSKKIGDSEYKSLDGFRDDFVVMCNNAMLYNGSDTIYYKSAEKMLSLGLKILSKEKLVKMNKSIGKAVSDSEDDDVMIDESCDVNIDSLCPSEDATCFSPPRRKRENRPASITASVLAAARKVQKDLLKKHPNQLYGYLGKDKEGNSTLNILNPDTSEENKSHPVTIGKVAGKLQTGITPGEAPVTEEKKNKVVPVNYLLYGPYGSFGPTYDSSLSNTTKEESDLLLQTYGSDLGVEYVKSITNFTRDSSFASDYVDGILDALTNGAHRKFKEGIKSKDNAGGTEVQNVSNTANTDTTSTMKDIQAKVDISSLMTLDGVGIDVTFLKNMVQPSEPKEIKTENDTIKSKLAQNTDLLQTLKQSQNARLSTKYGGTVPIPTGEIKVASSITDNLKDMMQMTTPRDVVSSEAVRRSIGAGKSSMNAINVEENLNGAPMPPSEGSTVSDSQSQGVNESIENPREVAMETS